MQYTRDPASQLSLGVPQSVKNDDWDYAHAQRALARGRASEAEGLCARRVSQSPKDHAAWHLLGLARRQTGDAGALEALNKAVALDKKCARYQQDLGDLLA